MAMTEWACYAYQRGKRGRRLKIETVTPGLIRPDPATGFASGPFGFAQGKLRPPRREGPLESGGMP
jgi:hypothetical protein